MQMHLEAMTATVAKTEAGQFIATVLGRREKIWAEVYASEHAARRAARKVMRKAARLPKYRKPTQSAPYDIDAACASLARASQVSAEERNAMEHHAPHITSGGIGGAAQVFATLVDPNAKKHRAGDFIRAARVARRIGNHPGDVARCLRDAGIARRDALRLTVVSQKPTQQEKAAA